MSKWTTFASCSATCGGGAVIKSRSATPASNAGVPCTGALMMAEPCNLAVCEDAPDCKNCLWSQWSDWTACTSCKGQSARHRKVEVEGNYCGLPCNVADAMELRNCEGSSLCSAVHYCTWSEWSAFNECPLACGDHRISRTRNLHWAINATEYLFKAKLRDLAVCTGKQESLHYCRTACGAHGACHPDDCYLEQWSPWVTWAPELCARTRSAPEAGKDCCHGLTFTIREMKSCLTTSIDCLYGDWHPWAMSKKVAHLRVRTRDVTNLPQPNGKPCEDAVEVVKPGVNWHPPRDCEMSMWSDWTECDKTCDTGQRHRERQVNVWEKYGGIACSTNLVELKPCNEGLQHLCQKLKNCTVSQWQEWTPCTKTCGTGQSMRERHVVQERNYEWGTSCNMGLSEARSCDGLAPCPIVPCLWGAWKDWSDCSQKCRGHKTRYRSISQTPSIALTANSCPAKTEEEITHCNVNASACETCPDGYWADWSDWATCTASCEGGHTWRSRKVAREASA